MELERSNQILYTNNLPVQERKKKINYIRYRNTRSEYYLVSRFL